MIKFILIILQIFLILLLVLFLINNSLVISIEFKDFIYSFSSSFFLLFFIIFFLIIFIIQNFYFKSKSIFLNFRINKKIKLKEKGYNAFVEGMIAIANKDYKKALTESKKMSNHLDDNPSLSLLLKSEVFKIEKRYDQLSLIYEKMIKKKNTENLGLRGMMEHYLRAQDYHHAFLYGNKLFDNNPFIEKIYDTLVSIVTKTNNWQELEKITNKALQKKIINKKISQENISIAFYEIAKIKKYSEPRESSKLISKALDLRKNFPPYVELYIELLIEEKKYKIAKKFLKQVWSQLPYTNYKFIIENLALNSKDNLLEMTKFIVGSSYQNEDSKILLVEASIKNKEWDKARELIVSLIDVQPKKNVCLLMAKIEEGDSNDIQKANSWKMRSDSGIANNIWICSITNKSQDEWTSVSNGGFFNSLEWRQPKMLKQIEDTGNLII